MYPPGNLLRSRAGNDGYEVSNKRQRLLDSESYFGSSPNGLSYTGFALDSSYLGQPRSFPVVRLRGLPFNCSEMDVWEFFSALDVVDALLIHKQGRFSGEAYVVFGSALQVDLALQKNKQNIGHRYVEIFRSKKRDYYHAVAAELSEPKSSYSQFGPRTPPRRKSSPEEDEVEHTGVLRLRGLPFSASKGEILDFFKEYSLVDENVHIVVHSDGRATGEAFVEFAAPGDAKSAMRKDKMLIGSRYVELFPSSREEAVRAASRSR